MSTPPGEEPPEDAGQQGGEGVWGAPQPPPGPGQPLGQPGQSWGQPEQQPGWQQPQPWSQPGGFGYGGARQTNGLAIGALVSSILGFFCWFPFFIGLILGYSARKQIRTSAGQQTGEGVATAAIVIGWIGVGLTVAAVLFFVLIALLIPAAPMQF